MKLMKLSTIRLLLDLGISVASSTTNLVNLLSSNRTKKKQLREEHISNVSSLIAQGGQAITDIVASAVSLSQQNKDVLLVDNSRTELVNSNVEIIDEEAANG